MVKGYIKVAKLSDLKEGTLLPIIVDDEPACLTLVEGKVYAFTDNCTHISGPLNEGEFDNARQKISDLLARERRTWKSFVDSMFSTSSKAWSDRHDHAASIPAINPLDLVHHLRSRYVEMTPHQFVAVSLWIAHTFLYQRFTVTPRLARNSAHRSTSAGSRTMTPR